MRKLYSLFYTWLPIKNVATDDQLYLLNDEEVKRIKQRDRIAITLAAFFGTMGVVLLIIPQYWFPHFFPVTEITLFNHSFSLPLWFWLYSAVLVFIELALLTFLNIWCAHEVAVATGFLNYSSKHTGDKRNLLLDIGLEKKNTQILKFGIDPLQQANRKVIFLWNLIFMMKATLSNFAFKWLVQGVFGRYAIKMLKDIVGIPIFAFWNAFGTHAILTRAKIIIMGENYIELVAAAIYKIQPEEEKFKWLLYDTLQYIAISKRDFHENHYLLTENLFSLYNISPKDKHHIDDDYLDRLNNAETKQKNILVLLIILGFLLDGKISRREKRTIALLNEKGVINEPVSNICEWAHDFIYGKGIDELLKKYGL